MPTEDSPASPAPADHVPTLPSPEPDRRTADIGLVLALVLLPAVVSAFVDIVWPVKAGGRPAVAGSALNMGAMLAGWAALVAFLISRGPRPASHFGLVRPRVSDVAIGVAIFLVVWQVEEKLTNLWGQTFGDVHDADWHNLFPAPPNVWWEYVILSMEMLAVGVVEELVWRGYLFTRWEEAAGSTTSALIGTSVLFGLAHLYQGPHGVLGAMADAFLFCGVFHVTRRLWPVALAHGLYDIVATLAG